MSFESERVFSDVKHIISDERARLKARTIEALKCCKSWLRIGLFTNEDITAALHRELDEIDSDEES